MISFEIDHDLKHFEYQDMDKTIAWLASENDWKTGSPGRPLLWVK